MLIAILAIIIGVLLVVKANWIVNTFGYVPSAEKFMRMFGGSRLFWKLLGILIIFISFLYISGLLEPLLLKLFGRTIESINTGYESEY